MIGYHSSVSEGAAGRPGLRRPAPQRRGAPSRAPRWPARGVGRKHAPEKAASEGLNMREPGQSGRIKPFRIRGAVTKLSRNSRNRPKWLAPPLGARFVRVSTEKKWPQNNPLFFVALRINLLILNGLYETVPRNEPKPSHPEGCWRPVSDQPTRGRGGDHLSNRPLAQRQPDEDVGDDGEGSQRNQA